MKTFKGKNAWWLIGLFVLYQLVPVYLIVYDRTFWIKDWHFLIWVIYYSVDTVWIPIMMRNRVELHDDYFVFYYGWQQECISVRDIILIEKSRNPAASTANSMDRIRIVTMKKEIYFSLQDNDEFIIEISRIRKKLSAEADG